MRRFAKIVGTVLMAFYPLGVWAGITLGGAKVVGIVALVFLVVVVVAKRRSERRSVDILPFILLPMFALLSLLLDEERLLFVTPVVINAVLLATFANSLRDGRTPMVETVARMIDGDLDDARVAYCRSVTKVWCAFFVINGSIALWLALFGSLAAWGLYTGAIAYGLMGLLFVAEYAVRKLRFG